MARWKIFAAFCLMAVLGACSTVVDESLPGGGGMSGAYVGMDGR